MRPARVLFFEHYDRVLCGSDAMRVPAKKKCQHDFWDAYKAACCLFVPQNLMASPSSVMMPDRAVIAYEVLGSHLVGMALPLVLVSGMSATRNDWRELGPCLAQSRPVLVYDHRGIGDSTYSSAQGTDEITMESLARDLTFLIAHLQWPEVAICGFSMGVVQQMLLLPYLRSHPTALPFRVTHVFLAGTRSAVLRDPQHGLQIRPTNVPRTPAERKELIRRTLQATFDPSWLHANSARFDHILYDTIHGRSPRPPATIEKQRKALQGFDFEALLPNISRNIRVLVIHGQHDQVIPFRCSQEMLRRIPGARFVELGNKPGQVPSLAFGHHWFEYFDLSVWYNVVDVHLRT
ncbi:Alpha/Beta hydrolase protein [Mycena rosella]|uniref:Alpha/Beta hydrolase protein n=1 Tax=Mycena rosella TaxID=1033263 RepID=A0AAD7GNU2_MYCRO|nr:Alpha/Beta hydrolase protein [Mycena rosella]